MSPERAALVMLIGLLAGLVNTLAGAGSLVTLPALLLLGVPANVANATNRVGVVVQSAAAIGAFSRGGRMDGRLSWRLLVPAGLGSIVGAQLSAILDPAIFERVVGVAMLVLLVLLFIQPEGWTPGGDWRARRWRDPVFFGVGLYGGFLQAGVGLFLLAALTAVEGLDLIRANAVKSFLVFGFTVPTLFVFGWHGLIDLRLALMLSVGSGLGGWLGGRLALVGGARVIRFAVAGAVLASATRLFGLW